MGNQMRYRCIDCIDCIDKRVYIELIYLFVIGYKLKETISTNDGNAYETKYDNNVSPEQWSTNSITQMKVPPIEGP